MFPFNHLPRVTLKSVSAGIGTFSIIAAAVALFVIGARRVKYYVDHEFIIEWGGVVMVIAGALLVVTVLLIVTMFPFNHLPRVTLKGMSAGIGTFSIIAAAVALLVIGAASVKIKVDKNKYGRFGRYGFDRYDYVDWGAIAMMIAGGLLLVTVLLIFAKFFSVKFSDHPLFTMFPFNHLPSVTFKGLAAGVVIFSIIAAAVMLLVIGVVSLEDIEEDYLNHEGDYEGVVMVIVGGFLLVTVLLIVAKLSVVKFSAHPGFTTFDFNHLSRVTFTGVAAGIGTFSIIAAAITILVIGAVQVKINVHDYGYDGHQDWGAIVMVIAGGLLLVTVLLIVTKLSIVKRPSSSASTVEIFLQDFTHEMPTRYSYSQLKKITNNFADKLGEGGFGVVYKGKLSNGNLLAIKILDQSRQSESQFMNEVATIGRIHHVHLVRLMGYCFESFRSALIYEYMANGSLEKFVFEKKDKPQILSVQQLYSIALGAARGIAYLHEECESRIIHFDIKPHNILLDADFTPKIADFGLAKLYGRLDDHISITAARGTPGYVAPELWSRNMGPITDKADVYSFGMLLLEIAGRRQNIDVHVSRSSELYLPEWVFNHLEKGELEERLRGRIREEMDCENEMQMMIKMSKIGVWCIQYNPMDRPTMSRVIQMFEGNGDELTNPPFPFNLSASLPQPSLMSSIQESSSI